MQSFNRDIKVYDEPHTPNQLEKLKNDRKINKGKLLNTNHFYSYFLQMKTISELKINSVLEVGPGESFIKSYMMSLGYKYHTMDIIEDYQPDILSSLVDFDETDFLNKYEVVCAFQVLEHIAYDRFDECLKKMINSSSKYVFISLPYSCMGFSANLTFMKGQNKFKKFNFKLFLPTFKRNRQYRDEYKKEYPWAVHYWEIGRKGYSLSKIRKNIEKLGVKIISEFHSENPYHYFFLIEKNK